MSSITFNKKIFEGNDQSYKRKPEDDSELEAMRAKAQAEARALPKAIIPYHFRSCLIDQNGDVIFKPERKFEAVFQMAEAAAKSFKTKAHNTETEHASLKNMPQYKYLTRPVFKACVEYIGPVAAAAISCLSADLIVHQFLPNAAVCCAHYAFSEEPNCAEIMVWRPWMTALWMTTVALPLMYAKHLKG